MRRRMIGFSWCAVASILGLVVGVLVGRQGAPTLWKLTHPIEKDEMQWMLAVREADADRLRDIARGGTVHPAAFSRERATFAQLMRARRAGMPFSGKVVDDACTTLSWSPCDAEILELALQVVLGATK